jgi:hypothetical protein
MERVDLIVQLRDQLIQSLLESFHASLLLAFNSRDDSGQLGDLLHALSEVVSILFLDLELEFGKSVVDLTE